MDNPLEIYNNVVSGKLNRYPNNFWTKGNSKIVIDHVISSNNLTSSFPECITKRFIEEHRLNGMLKGLFSNSINSMLSELYSLNSPQCDLFNLIDASSSTIYYSKQIIKPRKQYILVGHANSRFTEPKGWETNRILITIREGILDTSKFGEKLSWSFDKEFLKTLEKCGNSGYCISDRPAYINADELLVYCNEAVEVIKSLGIELSDRYYLNSERYIDANKKKYMSNLV